MAAAIRQQREPFGRGTATFVAHYDGQAIRDRSGRLCARNLERIKQEIGSPHYGGLWGQRHVYHEAGLGSTPSAVVARSAVGAVGIGTRRTHGHAMSRHWQGGATRPPGSSVAPAAAQRTTRAYLPTRTRATHHTAHASRSIQQRSSSSSSSSSAVAAAPSAHVAHRATPAVRHFQSTHESFRGRPVARLAGRTRLQPHSQSPPPYSAGSVATGTAAAGRNTRPPMTRAVAEP